MAAVLLPTQLPSVLEYNNFVSTHNFYDQTVNALTSINVTVTAVTVHARNTSNLLIVVGNVNTAGVLTGTFLGIGNSIRISGYHFGNFDYENWKYRKTKPDDTQYTVASYSLLPGQYFSLWNFTADVRTTTTINISVQTSAGNFTLTQTLYNNWDVGRDNMKRLVYLSDINRFTSSILATSSLTYLSGIGLVAPILTFDGTTGSISTWINRGATIDSTTGLTAVPSIRVTGERYAYTSVSIGSFLNKTITFNVNLTSGGTQLANVFFGTNAAGAGPFLRLDARSGLPSGFSTSTSWTAWSAPTTGVTITPGIWNSIAINITSSNVASWYLNNEFKGSSTVNLTGTNIAIHGDGAAVLGGNFDDLTIWQNITTEESGGGGGGGGGSSSGGVFTFSAQILTSTQNYDIRAAAVTSGWDQVLPLNATVVVANGVYVWSDTTSTAALVTGSTFPVGSTISIVNNGFIMGKGGWGGDVPFANTAVFGGGAGGVGGPAMSLGYNISLTNNSYIAGGGGGGGSREGTGFSGGGGGGGGAGGGASANRIATGIGTVVAGGAIGAVGNQGTQYQRVVIAPAPGGVGGFRTYFFTWGAGASGGRILPGTGGAGGDGTYGVAATGGAGGAGGGGGGYYSTESIDPYDASGGAGGSANNAGSNQVTAVGFGGGAGGGGGGWGAAGGNSTGANVGGAGGKAINLNGYSITYIVTGTLYGAVS